jgi:hypothetical protein
LTGCYYNAIWATRIFDTITGFLVTRRRTQHATPDLFIFANERTSLHVSAVVSLFFPSPRRRQSSISAAQRWSAADNFLQKQQKQRG